MTTTTVIAESATATMKPVIRELDSRTVDTDRGRYDVKLLWHGNDNTLTIAASVPGGDQIVSRKIPRHLASEAMSHPVVYLDLT